MKPSNAEFTAFVGLDWADAKHDVCVQAAGCEEREFDRFAHHPEHIEQWAHSLHQRFGGRIAVALELAKGPIVYALQKYHFLVLYPINPSPWPSTARRSSPAAPKMIPPMRNWHWICCCAIAIGSSHSSPKVCRCASCACWSNSAAGWSGIRPAASTACATRSSSTTLRRWSGSSSVIRRCSVILSPAGRRSNRSGRARQTTLIIFFKAHNVRFERVIEARLCAIKAATPLTQDAAVIEAHQLLAEVLVEHLRLTLKSHRSL